MKNSSTIYRLMPAIHSMHVSHVLAALEISNCLSQSFALMGPATFTWISENKKSPPLAMCRLVSESRVLHIIRRGLGLLGKHGSVWHTWASKTHRSAHCLGQRSAVDGWCCWKEASTTVSRLTCDDEFCPVFRMFLTRLAHNGGTRIRP